MPISTQFVSRLNLARLRRVTTASHRYMAEVDGLRFIAIFSVMLFHVWYFVTHVPGAVLAGSPFSFLFWPLSTGFRGVQLFFVISGFILGLPFAAQYLTHGPAVKTGKFYLRRVTRLEPPYILALLMFYGLAYLTHNVHTREPGFLSTLPERLAYLYYFIHGVPPSLDGVTWTLEIEVQFYLLAPLLARVFKLATLPRRLILIAAIFGAPALAQVVPRGEACLLGSAQYFLTGFLMADIYVTGAGAGWLPAWAFDLLAIGCLLVTALTPDKRPFDLFILPALLGGIFIAALRGHWFSSVLRRPLISILGGMCYSFYLLHLPILSFVTPRVFARGLSLPQAFLRLALAGLPFAIAAGIGYYVLIERPCMNPNWPRDAFQYFRRKFGVAPKIAAVVSMEKSSGN